MTKLRKMQDEITALRTKLHDKTVEIRALKRKPKSQEHTINNLFDGLEYNKPFRSEPFEEGR